MASREENVKKINDELEALSDEELDQVAGGHYKEVAADSRFLNDLAGLTDRYGKFKGFIYYSSIAEEVTKGWSKVGISVKTSSSRSNKYYKDGDEISREEALKYAAKKLGRDFNSMNVSEYNP